MTIKSIAKIVVYALYIEDWVFFNNEILLIYIMKINGLSTLP